MRLSSRRRQHVRLAPARASSAGTTITVIRVGGKGRRRRVSRTGRREGGGGWEDREEGKEAGLASSTTGNSAG